MLAKEEKKVISQIIKDNFGKYYSKYSFSKYPEAPYDKWKNIFPTPKNVKPEHIKQALEWKYGHWGKNNYISAHKKIISKVQNNWPDFVELSNYEIEPLFSFWRQRLINHQNFITISFIAHLIHNSTIEIIDQHNFRAMNYLLASIRSSWDWKRKPSKVEDIREYSSFFKTILPLLNLGDKAKRKLDMFLMMFGKHKAGKYKVRNIDKVKTKRMCAENRLESCQSSKSMTKIILISCTKSKRSDRSKAKDLYDKSDLFRKSWEYASLLNPDKIFILSAKYGLLNPNTEIDPYEVTLCAVSEKIREKNPNLKVLNKQERKDWQEKIRRQLSKVSDLQKDYFIFLAGEAYVKPLKPFLNNVKEPLKGKKVGERKSWLKSEIDRLRNE